MKIFILKIKNDAINFKNFVSEEDFSLNSKKIYGLLLKKFIVKLYSNLDTREVYFEKNKYGKPYFSYDIFFNISYSKDYVMGVVYDKEIGLDIEDLNNNINKILYKYGNKDSIDKNSLLENTKIWTRIESLLKFKGIGLVGIDKIKIINNNLITFSDEDNFVQTDITNKLPENICGTITTKDKIKNIYVFYINEMILSNTLNK